MFGGNFFGKSYFGGSYFGPERIQSGGKEDNYYDDTIDVVDNTIDEIIKKDIQPIEEIKHPKIDVLDKINNIIDKKIDEDNIIDDDIALILAIVEATM